MRHTLLVAMRTAAATLLLTGIGYPLVVTGLARLLFPAESAGSLTADSRGQVVGSALVGQPFSNPGYFQPRPSAAGAGYDGTASGGSNLGPTSKALRERAAAEVVRLRRENPAAEGPIPVDLVTASGSGLDPHLTPEGARWQVARVAAARGIAPDRIRAVLEARVEGRTLRFLGEPRVNVLALNLALDRQFGAPSRAAAP